MPRDDLTSLLFLQASTVGFVSDDARNRTDVNTPDSSNRHYTYNDANRIAQVRNTTNSCAQTFDYTHDRNGNIKSENSVTYGYDALNRLTSWVHSGVTTSYAYDDAGNLLQVSDNGNPVKSFTYNAANQITNTGFTYDLNGNMTSDGTFTYIYDGENRLKEVKQGINTIASYTYDHMARRTSVAESGTTTYFHYDGSNVVAETNSAGSTVATYTYDNTNQPVSMTRGGNTYYYQYNAHGDVVSLTNSLGQVVNTYTYDPWGRGLTASEQVTNPYRYAGYRYDTNTGLYYLRMRYYRPDVFRFLTRDLEGGDTGNPQSWNPYLYVRNNSLNFVDMNGLRPSSIQVGEYYYYATNVSINGAGIYAINIKDEKAVYVSTENPYLSQFQATIGKMYLTMAVGGLWLVSDQATQVLPGLPSVPSTVAPKQMQKLMKKARLQFYKANRWEREQLKAPNKCSNVRQ